jgi:hypothetical protein
MKLITALANKINYYYQLPSKFLIFLKNLNSLFYQLQHTLRHDQQASNAIFKKHKLEIELDNLYSPEQARELLVIFFKIKNSLPKKEDNVVIARSSSLNGYLIPIVSYLALKAIAISKDFTFFLTNFSKSSVIYLFDPSFAIFLFRDTSYLFKLRTHCRDELVIAIKIYTQNERTNPHSVERFIFGDHSEAFCIEKNEIFYNDSYIRWRLHDSGFFEVVGPFTAFPGDQYIRSRLVEDEGRFTIISDKERYPVFKGIAIYRASTKTFMNYLESL